MGLFDFLKKTPDTIADKADVLCEGGQFARAVREYEKALDRNRNHEPFSEPFEKTITAKISQAKNALAGQHIKNAADLIDSRCLDDARELLNLALELCDQEIFQEKAQKLLKEIADAKISELSNRPSDESFDPENENFFMDSEEMANEADDAAVLIHALPPDEQEAYQQYGDAFMEGFVALNQGDFKTAAECLEKALEEHRGAKTYIPLELATCYLNLGAHEKAKSLLESFMADFPFSLRAYPVLCETLWGLGEYDLALKRLESSPEELAEASLMVLLTGETLCEAKRPSEAVKVYQGYLEKKPDEETIARALAETFRTLGETEKARDLYGMLLDHCRNCHRKADPELKRHYADTAYETGHHTLAVLEIYLDVAEQDPTRRKEYYRKVSDIYASLGNENEALRFEAFSKREIHE
jgi:tetratricopeptide (TPR) repeat protein